MSNLFYGIVIGFILCVPVGPVGLICMQRTLSRSRHAGFVSGLGAATADSIYCAIAELGLTFISNLITKQSSIIRFGGGLIICILGMNLLFGRKSASGYSLVKTADLPFGYASTFMLALTNPVTIFSYTWFFAGLGMRSAEKTLWSVACTVTGVFAGSALWWFLLSLAVDTFRRKLLFSGLEKVNKISGLILTVIGICILFSLID
jgi:threonine/homoserine/homoserine lactone efflux protein